ncbi:MAG: cell division protein FtsQ [Tannerella sp.]|jgi:cell division protein FtsQ|nr:cell division protein FtsQ [Tannerella sp.]
MKRILSFLAAALMLGYLACALYTANVHVEDPICRELIVVIKDSLERRFIDQADVVASLKNASLYPVDLFLSRINTDRLERHIAANKLVATVSAYKTPLGKIKIEITQKMPILRVFAAGSSYYVDHMGRLMPADFQYATCLPVASGNIENSLAVSDLYKFALFLHEHEFWNNQIEQIYVHPNKEVELVPRVGNHRIILGDFSDFKSKMDNLQLFYEQVIPKIGWGKYGIINLKYRKQIVCTKK